MVYCGNNAFSAALKANGGHELFGTHELCFRKGYARGYNQKVEDIPHFIRKWTGAHEAHIQQKLWHSDEPVPSGYQLAILAQTLGRGYALGSIALAKKLKQGSKSARVPSKNPTLPGR